MCTTGKHRISSGKGWVEYEEAGMMNAEWWYDVCDRKLDERERRKKFVLEHNLIEYKSLQNKEKRKPKDERELLAKMRVFARFHSPEEHEKFVAVSDALTLLPLQSS